MSPTLLAIAVPALIFTGGCSVILRRKIRDDDVPLFREPTGRHTPEAVALANLQSLRPGAPLPAPLPAPVIEPAAITSGPPEPQPEPAPDAQIVITATRSGGRLTSTQVAVLPSLQWPAALPPWVAEELGHDSVDDAVESAFKRAMALEVRALTDGAP